jgi:4-amino-4-deoxy-L-arabinose transferase-like glycosyltransferase
MLILLIGAVLRCYRLTDIPFTYDEFSAITRTQFSSFHELIENGIIIDGHPAGVQVFLFYLTKLFGVSGVVLKTPFILCGLISVWLIYLIGKDWFNATVGLVAASFLSFLQFPVMYSQIARPYASGLCFVLLLVYFWTRIIFHPQRKYYLNLAGYIISGALCAYNHHFSMLFAAMVGITGLFYCTRDWMRHYITAGIIIILLYLPHLRILLFQMGIGGIEGWLSKPRYDFIVDFIRYIFHFSVYIYLLIIVLVSLALYWYEDFPRYRKKFFLISVTWFLVPYLIGFFYSMYRSAVLQYSVLIFSFPFLLFVLFGLFKTEKALHKIILITLIAVIVIPSLILERRHYTIFYNSPFSEIVRESQKATVEAGASDCLVLLDTKKEINQYYLDKYDFSQLPVHYFQDIAGKQSIIPFLDTVRTDYVALGSINCEIYAQVNEKFPFLVKHHTYSGGDFYLFSKIKPAKIITEYFYEVNNGFEPSLPEWGWVDETKCSDSLPVDGKRSYLNDSGAEFSPTFSKSLRSMIHAESDVIDVSADMKLPMVFPGAWLVITVTSDGKILKWISVAVNDFIKPGQQGRIYQSLRLSDVEFRHHRLMFNTYIWNPTKSNYVLDNFRVRVRSGNPIVYGLYREVGM